MLVVPSLRSHVSYVSTMALRQTAAYTPWEATDTGQVYGQARLFVCVHVENVKHYFSTASEHDNGSVCLVT